jgi:hypothetical protein
VRHAIRSSAHRQAVSESGQPMRATDFIGQPHAQHAAPRVSTDVDLTSLESHDGRADRIGQFAAPTGAEDDPLAIKEIVDRLRAGKAASVYTLR